MDEENLIKILTETLKFYADEANYLNDQVKKDGGVQARHILKIIGDNEKTIEKYEKLFDEFIDSKEDEETTPEQVQDFVKKLKANSEDYGR